MIAVVAEEFAKAFTHSKLDNIFRIADAPLGTLAGPNKVDKTVERLALANKQSARPPLEILGAVLAQYFDVEVPADPDTVERGRARIHETLASRGLRYSAGVVGAGAVMAAPSRSLETILRARDLNSVEREFTRALEKVEKEPDAAATAACAILESFCRIHIEDHRLEMPAKPELGSLWKVVRKDLKLDGGSVADDDVTKILQGLASIADGIAAFRTHAGSAHGKGRKPFELRPRHARLAVHAAHTLVVYLIERADEKTHR